MLRNRPARIRSPAGIARISHESEVCHLPLRGPDVGLSLTCARTNFAKAHKPPGASWLQSCGTSASCAPSGGGTTWKRTLPSGSLSTAQDSHSAICSTPRRRISVGPSSEQSSVKSSHPTVQEPLRRISSRIRSICTETDGGEYGRIPLSGAERTPNELKLRGYAEPGRIASIP